MPDLNAFNTTGQTALHIAAARGLDDVVTFLAGHGACSRRSRIYL